MNHSFSGRSRWSVLFLFFLCFSCGDDEMPTLVATPPQFYTIATTASVGGTITPTQTIAGGQTVSITATPQAHYQFKAWTGDCPIRGEESTLRFEVTGHCVVTAVFEKIPYAITATATTGGSVQGLANDSYIQGQAITLTAVPAANYQFIRWTVVASAGQDCPENQPLPTPTLRWVVQGPCALQAVFGTVSRTITTSIGAGGTITETQTVAHGQAVSITLTLEEGYELQEWTGDCGTFSADTPTITFPATQDCQVSARLQKQSHAITTKANAGGVIHGLTPTAPTHGDQVTLTAEPEAHHVFVTWTTEGAACPLVVDPTDPKLSFTVVGPCAIGAVFRKAQRTITPSVSSGGSITERHTVTHGQSVSISLTLEEGYELKEWTGDCGTFPASATTITFPATQDCAIQAVLQKIEEDPVDPVDPVNPVDPVDPDPVNPVDPVPVDPVDPVDPVNPVNPPPTPTTKNCNGQQIPVNDPCPDPIPDRTITTSVNTGGSITNTQTVPNGQTVTITVTVNQGYTLSEWTGTCGTFSNQQTTISFTASQNCQVNAVLAETPPPTPTTKLCNGQQIPINDPCPDPIPGRTITTSVNTGGSITNTQTVPNGQTVTITVTVNQGYTLSEWTGTCGTFSNQQTTITFTASQNCQVNAVLAETPPPTPTTKLCNGQQIPINDPCPDPIPDRTITTSVNTGGSITPDQTVPDGQTVSITVTVNQGYTLSEWTGTCGTFSNQQTTISFTASQNCQVNAVLAALPPPTPVNRTITTSVTTGGGSITPNQTVPNGQTVTITVTVNPGYTLSEWTGTCGTFSNQQTTISFTASQNCQVNAVLAETPPPPPQTKTCHGIQIPIDEECLAPLLMKQANDVTIIINPEIPNPARFVGQQATVDGTEYTIVDNALLRQYVAEDRQGAGGFNLDLDFVCTTLVTDMQGLFNNHRTFNAPIGDWDTRAVTDLRFLFRNARAFNQPIGDWDTSAVTDMTQLFQGATAFNQDLGDWDVSQVTSLGATFEGAEAFNQDLGDWNVSRVQTMTGTFNGARAFDQDISDWDVSSVVFMATLFSDASAFDQDISGWNVRNVRDCRQVACELAANRRPRFSCNQECLLTRHANGVTVTLHPRIRSQAIQNPSTYVGQQEILDGIEYTIVDETKLRELVAADNTDAKCTTLVTDMSSLFLNKASFNEAIGDWDVSRVTNMTQMFRKATVFNQAIGDWDTSRVTLMDQMFSQASAFNQDIGDWDVRQVTTMYQMFRSASAFNQDIGDWDVRQVTSTEGMFENAGAFNQDIGDWDVGRVTTMARMFSSALGFNQDLSDWDVDQVTNCLFFACDLNPPNRRPRFSNCTDGC